MIGYIKVIFVFIICALYSNVWAQALEILYSFDTLKFNRSRYPPADRDALQNIWNFIRKNQDDYTYPGLKRRVPERGAANCIWSAALFERDICMACADPRGARDNIALDGWGIINITTVKPCHDATIMVSPEGNYYYVDPYWNDLRIVQMQTNKEGEYEPIAQHRDLIPAWLFCRKGTFTGYFYVNPRFVAVKDDTDPPPCPPNCNVPDPFRGKIDCMGMRCEEEDVLSRGVSINRSDVKQREGVCPVV